MRVDDKLAVTELTTLDSEFEVVVKDGARPTEIYFRNGIRRTVNGSESATRLNSMEQ